MKKLSVILGALILGASLAVSLGALGQSSSGVSGVPSTLRPTRVLATNNGIFNAPAYSFSGATSRGMYFGANQVQLTSGGTSTVGVDNNGSWNSSKNCQSGFTRVTPNFCRVTTIPAFTSLTRNSCTLITATGERGVWLAVSVEARAANAVAMRAAVVEHWQDASCATGAASIVGAVSVLEFSPVAAGTTLVQSVVQGWALYPIAGQNIYLRFTDDAGNQGVASYAIYGYMD